MFYLMMQSTHFVLRLYGVRHGKGPFRERKPAAATWASLSD